MYPSGKVSAISFTTPVHSRTPGAGAVAVAPVVRVRAGRVDGVSVCGAVVLSHTGIMARYAAGVNYALVTVIAGEYQRVASFGRSALGEA